MIVATCANATSQKDMAAWPGARAAYPERHTPADLVFCYSPLAGRETLERLYLHACRVSTERHGGHGASSPVSRKD